MSSTSDLPAPTPSKATSTYRSYDDATKARVLQTWKDNGDWKTVARLNGVKRATAHGWVKAYATEYYDSDRSETPPFPTKRQRRGKAPKLTDEEQSKIVDWLEEKNELTLSEIVDRIKADFGKDVSITTIWRYIDGRCYTYKKAHKEPTAMNSDEKKLKRKEYVEALLEFESLHKTVIFIDETNFNLFTRRERGRSKAGTRCVQVLPTSKGQNLHIIGGICKHGIVYWEHKRGAYRKQDARSWTKRLIEAAMERGWRKNDLVIVLDNAPVHSNLECIATEDDGAYSDVSFLRLGPYSPQLNPIEILWSSIKAKIKAELAVKFAETIGTPPSGVTLTEHRLQVLEGIAVTAMNASDVESTCQRACDHVKKHYATCMALRDLPVGE